MRASGAPPKMSRCARGGTSEPASPTECRPCKRAYVVSTSAQTWLLSSAVLVTDVVRRNRQGQGQAALWY